MAEPGSNGDQDRRKGDRREEDRRKSDAPS
jgi:hypothetical protein